jgi:outer membrane murein-binding lipoprotein Lpp
LQKLPGQIQHEIKTAMNNELEIMKQEISKNTKDLESEMMNLRAKAIQLDHEKRSAKSEVARLTHNLTHLHYEDEIRTHELIED